MRHATKNGHAIVIGASMAGLLAARVLADHFAEVTVLERDADPPYAKPRKGVPQAMHAHGLLSSGRHIIESLFPGICDDLVGAGAIEGDIARDVSWHASGSDHVRFTSGLKGILVSRPLLESEVRRRLLALVNVSVLYGCDVLGVTTDASKKRITGLRFVRRDVLVTDQSLSADLVVDASGPASRTPLWLTQLGYPAPTTHEVRCGISYTTRYFRRKPHHLDGRMGVVIAAQPPNPRVAAMVAQEGGRWVVTLGGYRGVSPPADHEAFLNFARLLPSRAIYDAIRNAEPASAFYTFNFPASIRRRYERMTRFPEGLLVMGDAVSRFNPVYGQGMSSAALQAAALGECLGAGRHALARRVMPKLARVVDTPWAIAAGADSRFPEIPGARGPMVRFFNWYLDRLQRVAHADPAASLAIHRVANLIASPTSLLHPSSAMHVMRSLIQGPAIGAPKLQPQAR